ncbi:MAG: lipid II flippase MurJ, partial [Planctomycetota bacterium]
MIKGFRQIASLTVVSRILGLIRDMAFSRILGAGGLMDIWIIAFQIPNLSRRLFGEGAASASLIPVYREQLETDPESAKKFARTMVTVVFTLLSAVVLIGWIGIVMYRIVRNPNTDTKLMVDLIAVMLPYMILICSVAILAGILNVHKQFAAPAFAPIILNLFIIASLLLTGWVFDVPGRIK